MKTTAFIFRILGLILFAIAGYYLGDFLAGIIDSNLNHLALNPERLLRVW